MTEYAEATDAYGVEDQNAPRAIVFVEGEKVEDQILADIKQISYENSLYLTDELKIELANKDGRYTDAVMWGHGNEIEMWLGYGQQMYYIGRAEIVRHMPTFSDGVMLLPITARDKSWRMKKVPPRISGGRQPTRRSEVKSQWEGYLSAYLKQVAKKYGFKTIISKKFDKVWEKFIQKRGQTDFQTVQALANFHYASFMIDYRIEKDPREGSWFLIFRDIDETEQDAHYTFRYKEGELSTILGVTFEFGISETITEVKAYYWDPTWKEPDVYKKRKLTPADRAKQEALAGAPAPAGGVEGSGPVVRKLVRRGRRTGAWREVSASDYKKEYKKVPIIATPGGVAGAAARAAATATGKSLEQRALEQKAPYKKVLKKDHDPFKRLYKSQRAKIDENPTPTRLRLAVGGHSVEILTRPFKNAEEARTFILNWIKQNQNNFITAKGTLPGIDIKAGETHALEGPELGRRFSGEYFFTNVTQKYGEDGWTTEFQARKVLTPDWLKRQREANKGLLETPEN